MRYFVDIYEITGRLFDSYLFYDADEAIDFATYVEDNHPDEYTAIIREGGHEDEA